MEWNVSCVYLAYCVSHILFGMSLAIGRALCTTHIHSQAHSEQYTTHTIHKTCCHSTNST